MFLKLKQPYFLLFLALSMGINGISQSALAQNSERGGGKYSQYLTEGYNAISACQYNKIYQACSRYEEILSILNGYCSGDQEACRTAITLVYAYVQAKNAVWGNEMLNGDDSSYGGF